MSKTHNPALPPPQDLQESAPRLEDLARQARDAHATVRNAFSNALEHALKAGSALIAAKDLVPDGRWLKWLRAECDISERTSQLYMQLARAQKADPQRVADWSGLSLRAAVKRLTPPQPKAAAAPRAPPAAHHTSPTTGLDILAAWDAAPPAERQRAVMNIGLRPLLQALPRDWLPAVESWVVEQLHPAITPVTIAPIETDENGFPELPNCLRRVPVTTH